MPSLDEVILLLENWDGRVAKESAAATVYEVFLTHWVAAVAAERFPSETATFFAGGATSLASALLREDPVGWFPPGKREPAIRAAMTAALRDLEARLGPDLNQWHWGRLHTLTLRHILSGRGDLGRLLDHGGVPVPGDPYTVCNTGLRANFEAGLGATYRAVADLSASPPGLWSVDSQSQSGHPGSPHYADQLPTWLAGQYHYLPLDPAEASRSAATKLVLEPAT